MGLRRKGGASERASALEGGGPDEQERVVGEFVQRSAAHLRADQLQDRPPEAVAGGRGHRPEDAVEFLPGCAGGVGCRERVEVVRGELPALAWGWVGGRVGGGRVKAAETRRCALPLLRAPLFLQESLGARILGADATC